MEHETFTPIFNKSREQEDKQTQENFKTRKSGKRGCGPLCIPFSFGREKLPLPVPIFHANPAFFQRNADENATPTTPISSDAPEKSKKRSQEHRPLSLGRGTEEDKGTQQESKRRELAGGKGGT